MVLVLAWLYERYDIRNGYDRCSVDDSKSQGHGLKQCSAGLFVYDRHKRSEGEMDEELRDCT